MLASHNGHVEAMRVLIEKGALIEAADEVRIHSHATTHARSQSLIHTHMHTLACTVACVAATAPDLRTLAGWLGRTVGHR